MMVTLVYGRPYAADRDMLRGGEMFTLALFALLGMFVMISGSNFLVIYLAWNCSRCRSYALVALRRDHAVATEAAMKYFVLGAHGQRLPAVRHVDAVRRHRLAGHQRGVQGHRQPARSSTRCWCSAWCSSSPAWPSSWAPRRSTCGSRRLPGRADGGHADDRRARPKLAAFAIAIRLLVEGLLPLAIDWQQMLMVLAVALAAGRQPGGHRADQPQAHAGLFDHRPDGLRAAGPAVGRGQRQHAATPPTPTARRCSTSSPTC